MKIATRIALLQWQANPADPANLWRLILAWIVPGTREPREEKSTIDWTKNPYQLNRRAALNIPRKFLWSFGAGVACGAALTWVVFAWFGETSQEADERAATAICADWARSNPGRATDCVKAAVTAIQFNRRVNQPK